MAQMSNKVAIVTGAARGTGLVTAERLAEEGAAVIMVDVRDERGEAEANALAKRGLAVSYRSLDVTDEGAWQTTIADVITEHGSVDALVNNAAVLHVASIDDTSVDDFERILRVNVIGPFLGIKAVAPHMRAQRSGSIVNVASVDALISHNGVVAYASSKFALRGLTKTAAIELGEFGVRVNTVCPSGGSFSMIKPFIGVIDLDASIASPKRSILADESDPTAELTQFANMVVFLCSDAAGGCTGSDYPVDRGQTAGYRVHGMPGDNWPG